MVPILRLPVLAAMGLCVIVSHIARGGVGGCRLLRENADRQENANGD
jgi:hypothetical protein